jgi:hypothetical protein
MPPQKDKQQPADIVDRLNVYATDWRERSASVDCVMDAIAEIERLRDIIKRRLEAE